VIALENSADWVAIVTGLLQHQRLSNVEIRHAPMEPIQVAGHEQPWYLAAAIADVEETLPKWLAEVPGLSLVPEVDHLAVMKIS
jgi:hypothetical protein